MGVNSVAAQTFKGSFFSIGSAVITIVSGFVRTVILAMFFVSVLGPIRNFGFNQALIHRDTNIQEASSTYFILRVRRHLQIIYNLIRSQ
jgi:hypothetical protein